MSQSSVDPVSVYFVDDDPAMVRYVDAVLTAAGYNVHPFTDVDAFLAVCDSAIRGCILLDVQMPSLSGPELQTVLHQRGINAPVLFLTGQGDVTTAVEVMRRGALDLIEKPISADDLVARVRRAIDEDAGNVRRRDAREVVNARWRSLSAREQEVCVKISMGDANKTVAREFGISERTVEVHRSKVMMKMGASSLAELVLMYSKCHD